MSTPDALREASGTWNGTSRLHMHEEPTREGPSSATLSRIAQGKWATLHYTWDFEGQPQDGMLLISQANEPPSITVAWIDSWHMGDALLLCKGHVDADQRIVVRGTYQVEGSPDWGWRIDLLPTATTLQILMYNVAPDGTEYPAVEAHYQR
jgi:hypothetical protein